MIALACEPPELSGRPISDWTHRELRDEMVARTIVETISVSQVGRILLAAAVQPHRKKMWLNTTEKDAEKFQREVENVCKTYLEAPAKAAANGTHTASINEATALQAIERNAPDKPVQIGSVKKSEFKYTRHGTTTLTAGLDVVNGLILSPTLEPTRTEPEFVQHIERTVNTDANGEWVFVVDGLNTPASESLVMLVAEKCNLSGNLGKKGRTAFLNPWPPERNSFRTRATESVLSTSRNSVRGSIRLRSCSVSFIENAFGAATLPRWPTLNRSSGYS